MRLIPMATLALATALQVPVSHAQQATEPHCTADKKVEHYLCDAAAFQRRLAKAHAVRVDTDRMDLFGHKQMVKLATDLGKQIAAPGQRPDLIFAIAPVDRSGRIDFGPGDTALATLTVYDPAKGAGRVASSGLRPLMARKTDRGRPLSWTSSGSFRRTR